MAKSANSEFDAFVKRQQAAAKGSTVEPVDWNKEREEWLRYLDDLYSDIQLFLKAYIDDGSVRFEFQEMQITEEDIGTYEARRMTIYIGSQTITLTPVGTLLIGSKGRVDVEGSAGRSRLVLINKSTRSFRDMIKVTATVIGSQKPQPSTKQEPEVNKPIEWGWKIVNSPPTVNFTDLNAESFLQMLLEVSNG